VTKIDITVFERGFVNDERILTGVQWAPGNLNVTGDLSTDQAVDHHWSWAQCHGVVGM
jgi:hypothetical protein